jgi:hypothetical protein
MKIKATAEKFEQPADSQPKSTKNPPMAAAIRRFVTEMAFPPLPKSGPNHNVEYAGIIQAILSFAHGIRADVTEIKSDPSMDQIAAVCHSDRRTVERHMAKLKKHGQITVERRGGRLSNVFTVHKGVSVDATTVVVSETDESMRQLADLDATTPNLDTTTRSSRYDNSILGSGAPNASADIELQPKRRPNPTLSLDNTSGKEPLDKTTLGSGTLPPLPSAGVRKLREKVEMKEKMEAAIAELDRRNWAQEPERKRERDLWERAIVLFLGSLRSSVGSGVSLNVLYKDAEEDGINLPTDDDGLYGVIELLRKLKFVVRVKSTIYLAEYSPKGDK